MQIVDPRVDPALVPEGSRPQIVNGPSNEWKDLPSVLTPDGQVITRWMLTPEERVMIAGGADIYVTLVSAGVINPFFVTVGPTNWRETGP